MSEADLPFDPLETVTVREAAALLHVSQPTARKYIRNGQLPSLLIGRCRRIRRIDLQAFIEGRLTFTYRPMDNRHKQEGHPSDPVFQDGAEGSLPF